MTTDARRPSRQRARPVPFSTPARRPRPPRGTRDGIRALTRRWPPEWLDRLNGRILDNPDDPLFLLDALNRDHLRHMVLEAMAFQSWVHPVVDDMRSAAKAALGRLIRGFAKVGLATEDLREVAETGIAWLEQMAQLDPAPLARLRRCQASDCPRPYFWDLTDPGLKRFCSDSCRLRSWRQRGTGWGRPERYVGRGGDA